MRIILRFKINTDKLTSNTNSNKVVAVIVSYQDTEALEITTKAICQQVSRTVVVDNASGHKFDDALCRIEMIPGVVIIRLEKNEGIAKALNIGVKEAKRFHAEWIITLDQDTVCESKLVEKLLCIATSNNNVGIVAASTEYKNLPKDKSYPTAVITSGNLVNKLVYDDVSYNEKYFIDSVDFDFCLRTRKSGWKIIQSNRTFIKHRLGTSYNVNFSGFKFCYVSHLPLRRYYIFRNHIFLIKDHFSDQPIFLIKKSINLFKALIYILLFDSKRIDNLRNIVKGIYHGFINKNN